MRRLTLAAGLSLACLLGGVSQAAPPPASPPRPAASLSPVDAARALHLETGRLRLAAAVSFDAVWRASTPAFRQAAAILTPRDDDEALLLTDFFAHATLSQAIQGDQALTGWRDPLTDVWVLGDWSRDGDGWRLDHLTMSLTQDLGMATGAAGAPLQPAFPGLQSDGLARALVAGQFQAVQAFRRASQSPAAIDWSVNSAAPQRARQVALLRLRAAEGSQQAIDGVAADADRLIRVALVEETPLVPAVSSAVAKRLHARSVETRLSLLPIQYLPARGEVVAIVQSALEPEQVFVTHLAPTGVSGVARVANVEAIDLSKAE